MESKSHSFLTLDTWDSDDKDHLGDNLPKAVIYSQQLEPMRIEEVSPGAHHS